MSRKYTGNIGQIDLQFQFRFEDTSRYFKNWLSECTEDILNPVQVTQQDFDDQKRWGLIENSYVEFLLSAYRTCDYLLKYSRCIFHGAVFLWKGKAFIFTAQSGVGKSTQLFHWLKLYGDEIKIMNGDKPVLYSESSRVIVYPSPWKGKEGLGSDSLTAPLGGIIILEQGKENHIERLIPQKSVPQLLMRILFTAETEESVRNAGRMIEAIVMSVPVWKLINKGDADSAKLTHETIRKELNL
ncbi:MAG: hypothetical protein Q4C20_01310 [Erysipelotrichaceae bacterium]|nr:hypothetical protein [Erysipelotrichaceae bacterium]